MPENARLCRFAADSQRTYTLHICDVFAHSGKALKYFLHLLSTVCKNNYLTLNFTHSNQPSCLGTCKQERAKKTGRDGYIFTYLL